MGRCCWYMLAMFVMLDIVAMPAMFGIFAMLGMYGENCVMPTGVLGCIVTDSLQSPPLFSEQPPCCGVTGDAQFERLL